MLIKSGTNYCCCCFWLQTSIQQKKERIEELEEALRESVRITAQREMDMAELQAQIDASKSAVSLSACLHGFQLVGNCFGGFPTQCN